MSEILNEDGKKLWTLSHYILPLPHRKFDPECGSPNEQQVIRYLWIFNQRGDETTVALRREKDVVIKSAKTNNVVGKELFEFMWQC